MKVTARQRDLLALRIITLGVVVLAIPVGAFAVFVAGADRKVAVIAASLVAK